MSAPLTLGTAGHIDHGKTALIGALTGRDTDRLPEERARGISIELGYARLDLPSGRALSVIDVPGHERFVRTMVAGASGIDLFLLCVAADDGVMPQTLEHLAVLRHLGVGSGVAAVTKSDAGEPELVSEEVAELLPEVPVVRVSAHERTGLDELLLALDRVAAGLPGRAGDPGPLRLHVDRSFTLRGIGTVVTGTLWSGSVAEGDRVTILPRGLGARVRSVQVHDEPVASAQAGQRVALALAGRGWREIARGDLVVSGGEVEPTYRIDARVSLEVGTRALDRGERLHVHHGTRDAPARVAPLEGDSLRPGETALVQLRLEAPLMPAAGDRVVLRRVAPPDTIGGGVVIDPSPRRHGGGATVLERLGALERGETPPEPAPPAAAAAPKPTAPVLDDGALRLAALLESDGTEPRADGDLAAEAGLEASAATAAWRALERAGRAVRVSRNLHFAPAALDQVTAQVIGLCERDGAATIAGVRDALGTSRRFAQAVLEHLDSERITVRRGDEHHLRGDGPS